MKFNYKCCVEHDLRGGAYLLNSCETKKFSLISYDDIFANNLYINTKFSHVIEVLLFYIFFIKFLITNLKKITINF